MSRRKPSKRPAQLEREIVAALKKPRRHHATRGQPTFHDLVHDEDPNAMQVAEDILLEKGWKISEVAGGTRHGYIEMNRAGEDRSKLRMVAWHTPEPRPQSRFYPRVIEREIFFNVNLGKNHLERRILTEASENIARKIAAANAWAVAKAIKTLPLNTDVGTLARIVDHTLLGADVMLPVELF